MSDCERGTGRTTRMLLEALNWARPERTARPGSVGVLARDARLARAMRDRFVALACEAGFSLSFVSTNWRRVTVEGVTYVFAADARDFEGLTRVIHRDHACDEPQPAPPAAEVAAKVAADERMRSERVKVESAKASCLLGIEQATDRGDGEKAKAFAEAYRALCG